MEGKGEFKVDDSRSEKSTSNSSSTASGLKSIGLLASISLVVNNVTGPGVPQLPNMFAESGWLLPAIVLLGVWGMSTLSATMFCEAMRKIPGNENFSGRAEYTTVVRHYFGERSYRASLIGLSGALQALNIVSVVQSARVMDNLISKVFGQSCALNFSPFQNWWTDSSGTGMPLAGSNEFFSCIDTLDLAQGNAWGCHLVLTAGFVLTASMAIPCGWLNLDDNMPLQMIAFGLTCVCWCIWIAASASSMDDLSTLPAINTDPHTGSQAAVLGTILFNFGFVTTVPSWVNEKRENVSVNKSLWMATALCVLVMFAVGLPGAAAFGHVLQGPVSATCPEQVSNPSFNCPNDLLQIFVNPVGAATDGLPSWWQATGPNFLLAGSVYLFPIVAVVSSIPIYSIVVKYNLRENGMSRAWSFFWGAIFPWLAALPLLYMPNMLSQLVNFSSLIFVSITDFIVPWALYVKLQKQRMMEEEREEWARQTDSLKTAQTEGVHYAIPQWLAFSPWTKIVFAIGFATILGLASTVATVMTIMEGTYTLDRQVCALVGS